MDLIKIRYLFVQKPRFLVPNVNILLIDIYNTLLKDKLKYNYYNTL